MRCSVRVLLLPPLILLLGLTIHAPSARALCSGVVSRDGRRGSVVRYDEIFLGHVVSQFNPDSYRSDGYGKYRIVVEQMWKGTAGDTITVVSNTAIADCPDLKLGESYLVLAHRRDGEVFIDCCGTRLRRYSTDMLRALDTLPVTGDPTSVDLALLDLYLTQLHDPSEQVRAEAAGILGGFGQHADWAVGPLLEIMRTDSRHVAGSAVWAISQLGLSDSVALPIFLEAFEQPRTRSSAIQALSDYRDSVDIVVPLFRRAVKDPDVKVRWAALQSLSVRDSVDEVLPEVLPLLQDPEASVRWRAVRWIVYSDTDSSSVESVLVEATRDPNPDIRADALEMLFNIAPVAAQPLIARALDDPAPQVKNAILELLSDEEAPDHLRNLAIDRGLGDPDPEIRASAAELLFMGTSIGTKRREQQVERAFADWHPEVWDVLASGRCGCDPADLYTPALQRRLLTRVIMMPEHGVPASRAAAFRILNRWGFVEDFIPLYERALVSPYNGVRREAIRGLSRVGAAAAPALPRLRTLAVGTTWQAKDARRAIADIEAAMIRP